MEYSIFINTILLDFIVKIEKDVNRICIQSKIREYIYNNTEFK